VTNTRYLAVGFDAAVRADSASGVSRGADSHTILVAMLAIHSECVLRLLQKDYPDGVGGDDGEPSWGSGGGTKSPARMISKSTSAIATIRDHPAGGAGRNPPPLPNRPGESWYPNNGEDVFLRLPHPAPRCLGGSLLSDGESERRAGVVRADVEYARAATAVSSLCDAVRFSVTSSGDPVGRRIQRLSKRLAAPSPDGGGGGGGGGSGGPGLLKKKDRQSMERLMRELEDLPRPSPSKRHAAAIDEQERLLNRLTREPAHADRWQLIEISNDLQDETVLIKCVVCNLVYTPLTDAPPIHGSGAAAAHLGDDRQGLYVPISSPLGADPTPRRRSAEGGLPSLTALMSSSSLSAGRFVHALHACVRAHTHTHTKTHTHTHTHTSPIHPSFCTIFVVIVGIYLTLSCHVIVLFHLIAGPTRKRNLTVHPRCCRRPLARRRCRLQRHGQ
jgi:hypothetical protein